jgi:hypothetical protein
VLIRCLQKDLKKRYRDIAEAKYEMELVLTDPVGVWEQPVTAVEPQLKLRRIVPWIAMGVILAAIITGSAVWLLKPPPPPNPGHVMRFQIELPEGQQFAKAGGMRPIIAVSRDGRQLVYATPKGLYLRSLDDLTVKPIDGSEGNVEQPFFSPEGNYIGYYSDGR